MRRFQLERGCDEFGMPIIVARGCEFAEGTCFVNWDEMYRRAKDVIRGMDEVGTLFASDGITTIVWID